MTPSDGQVTVAAEVRRTADAEIPPKNEMAGSGNLDKVRDILFGNQMRDIDRRLGRLEERLIKETNEVKADLNNRLDAFNSYVRHEAESLAGRIDAEHRDRQGVDEQLSKEQRELRQQLLDQHRRLSDDLRRKVEEVLAALARETGELRSDKADRAMLASLLNEMAMRLTNELTLPEVEGDAGA